MQKYRLFFKFLICFQQQGLKTGIYFAKCKQFLLPAVYPILRIFIKQMEKMRSKVLICSLLFFFIKN